MQQEKPNKDYLYNIELKITSKDKKNTTSIDITFGGA